MRSKTDVMLWFAPILNAVQDKINCDRCLQKPHWLNEDDHELRLYLSEEFAEWNAAICDSTEFDEIVDVIASALMLADKIYRSKNDKPRQ